MSVKVLAHPGLNVANKIIKPSTALKRANLQPALNNLKPLAGPEEVEKAKACVAINVAENAAIAAGMAQMPGWDEVALAANEMKMAAEIYNGIYKFNFGKTVIKSIIMGIVGNKVGTSVFKAASKLVTWIPLLGNSINATVSGTTTVALGAAIIANAEEMDKARKRGENLDKFFKKLGG